MIQFHVFRTKISSFQFFPQLWIVNDSYVKVPKALK
jgi:hypothetical protein